MTPTLQGESSTALVPSGLTSGGEVDGRVVALRSVQSTPRGDSRLSRESVEPHQRPRDLATAVFLSSLFSVSSFLFPVECLADASSTGTSSSASATPRPALSPEGEHAGPSADDVSNKGPAEKKRVDVNSATVEELCTLPGIGPKKAEAIIALREKRPLTRLTQLLLVRGIGKKTLEKLRPEVEFGPPKRKVPEGSVKESEERNRKTPGNSESTRGQGVGRETRVVGCDTALQGNERVSPGVQTRSASR